MNKESSPIEDRSIPEPNSGCWLWVGPYNSAGYGCFGYRGVRRSAHRASWEAVNGHIPDGLWVLHKCDNPPCVNPDHLYVGTHADNTRDAIKRGRFHKWNGERSGESNPRAVLTFEHVEAIRRDDRGYGLIAKEYGVSETTIRDVKKGLKWKNAIK